MPVQSCQLNNKPGFRWGEQGKCYTYTPGNESSRERARARAIAQGRAFEFKAEKQLEDVCRCFEHVVFMATRKPDKMMEGRINSLDRLLMREWTKRLKVLDLAVAKHFSKSGDPKSSDGKRVIDTADKLFNGFADKLRSEIEKDVRFVYLVSKTDFVDRRNLEPTTVLKAKKKPKKKPLVPLKVEIVPAFTKVDKDIIDGLANQHLIASNAFYRKNLSSEVTQIVQQTLKEGKNFRETGDSLRRRLGKKLGLSGGDVDLKLVPEGFNGPPRQYFKGLGETTLNRARSFSSTIAIAEAGFSSYEIFNASPVAVICQEMNGRVFTITQAREHIQRVLSSESPDDLKDVAGWRKNLSEFGVKGDGKKLSDDKFNASLADAGLALPPYHFRCATTVEPLGTTTERTVAVTPDKGASPVVNRALGSADDIVVGDRYLWKGKEITINKRFFAKSKGKTLDLVGFTTEEGKFKTSQVHVFVKDATRLNNIPPTGGGKTIPLPTPKPERKPKVPKIPKPTGKVEVEPVQPGVRPLDESKAKPKLKNKSSAVKFFKDEYNIDLVIDEKADVGSILKTLNTVTQNPNLAKILKSDRLDILDFGAADKTLSRWLRGQRAGGSIDGVYMQSIDTKFRLGIFPQNLRSTSQLRVLVHEMGHALDRMMLDTTRQLRPGNVMKLPLRGPTPKPGAKNVWGKPPHITSYAKTHPSEDFAESFSFYFTNPEKLKAVAPDKFDEIEKLIKEFL